MATFSNNGVNIYYEDTGEGYPLVWSHEFAGNYDSWEPQARFFTRRYRVITYAARGYPPSDVPEDPCAYSQEHAVDDLRQLLGHLGIEQAHLGGLSMGGAVVLNFGFVYPEMCRSLVVASAGSGTTDREAFLANSEAMAARLLAEGMGRVADEYTRGNTRVQLLRKDPRGWQEFRDGMAAHSAMGSALTFRGFQIKRPTIYQLEEQLKALQVPTLIMIGDEDEPCVEPSIFMKRRIPSSGLSVFPQSGHAINLEEPDLFNRTVLDFLTAVEAERWA
jgi:pimeloyl-ACP methyl ester carboxylesterase